MVDTPFPFQSNACVHVIGTQTVYRPKSDKITAFFNGFSVDTFFVSKCILFEQNEKQKVTQKILIRNKRDFALFLHV